MGKIGKLYEQKQSNSSQKSSMASLLVKKSADIKGVSKGDIIKGTITKLTRSEILVDINTKALATVLEKEKQLLNNILDTLKVGDEVSVQILNPESDTGNSVVSLRRFMESKLWDKLRKYQKSQEPINAVVTESTKGGFVASLSLGTSGFLPFSHVIATSQLSVGKDVEVYVVDTKQEENKIILSQKQVLGVEELKQAKQEFKLNQKIKTLIVSVTNFGVFVALSFKTKDGKEHSIDGLVHASETSWDKLDISSSFKPGEEIEVVVIGFDDNARRVDLSIKRLEEDPFEKISKKFAVDTKTKGKVIKISSGNIHIDLGENAEGVIKKEKVPAGTEYKVGDEVSVIVSDLDKRHRVINLVPHLLKKTIGYR